MDFIRKIANSPRFHNLGEKLADSYRLGRKIFDGGLNLGKKAVNFADNALQNPIVSAAVDYIPYGGYIRKGVELGKKGVEYGEKIQNVLNTGEALYNVFKNNIKVPPHLQPDSLRRSQGIERNGRVNKPIPPDGNSTIMEAIRQRNINSLD